MPGLPQTLDPSSSIQSSLPTLKSHPPTGLGFREGPGPDLLAARRVPPSCRILHLNVRPDHSHFSEPQLLPLQDGNTAVYLSIMIKLLLQNSGLN